MARVEKELTVCEVKARTERCDICQYTYIPSEIIDTDGERLCMYFFVDKFGVVALYLYDIPFYFLCTPCSVAALHGSRQVRIA